MNKLLLEIKNSKRVKQLITLIAVCISLLVVGALFENYLSDNITTSSITLIVYIGALIVSLSAFYFLIKGVIKIKNFK